MNKLVILCMSAYILSFCATGSHNNLIYPATRKVNVVDTIFGTPVPDPYRWLEDDRSEETEQWVKEQNLVTFDYLGKIPYREDIKNRLSAMWNYEKYTAPFIEGDYTYFTKNNGLQNQYVVYRQKEGQDPEIFLDPNKFSADGTISLGEMGFSKDGSLIAYSISLARLATRNLVEINAPCPK